ncbi:MAG: hypothetical protein ACRD2R_05915 [Terriglobales bacterium]
MEDRRRSAIRLAAAIALVLLLGVLDYLTGPEISFYVFYLLPVSLAAWSVGRAAGIGVSLLCAAAWLIANAQGSPFNQPGVLYWNCLARLATFVFVAVLATRRAPPPKTPGQEFLEELLHHKYGDQWPRDLPLKTSDTLDWVIPLLLTLNIFLLGGVVWYFGYLRPRP